jgi:predicted HTH transcriptional regulator
MDSKDNDLDLRSLAEAYDLECKAAQGRHGRGEIPSEFWKSYSAMANAEGGIILLGVEEKPRGNFVPVGLVEIERVRKALWDNLHNRKQIRINHALLNEQDITLKKLNGKKVLYVQVPSASRKDKPVHLGENPFGGTYLRRHERDYLVDDESVRHMLAERVEDSRDETILPDGYDVNDLDFETLTSYRNRFAAVQPGHVWSDLPLNEFLECIGAIGKDRESGRAGLRLAGLLMFGRSQAITDALPYYMVDYQEQTELKSENRWIDRLVPDGSWSGNLYDFFRKVYQKLVVDLKAPFQLKDGQRVDDTPVHEALREALANTLVHADFSGRVSVKVVKRPDMFGFSNPGLMRIPREVAVRGGSSDCRNRKLQTMFRLVGYGDHAGSGLPKIYQNWAGQHWRTPVLAESFDLEQTHMELRMISLLPVDVVSALKNQLGDSFQELTELARIALVTASVEGVVNHSRLREISTLHSADITKILIGLVRDGFLVSRGSGRGTVYELAWQAQTTHFISLESESESMESEGKSMESEWQILWAMAEPFRSQKRLVSPGQKQALKSIILQLCYE